MPAAAAPLYPAKTIAKLFNLTDGASSNCREEGIIPKAERGKYKLIGAVQGYVKYLQDRALGQHDAAPTDLNAESEANVCTGRRKGASSAGAAR